MYSAQQQQQPTVLQKTHFKMQAFLEKYLDKASFKIIKYF